MASACAATSQPGKGPLPSRGTIGTSTCVAHWQVTSFATPLNKGPSLSPEAPGLELSAISGTGPSDLWSVGGFYPSPSTAQQTLVEHWNGLQWSVTPSPNLPASPIGVGDVLDGVVAVSPSDTWAVGNAGIALYPSSPADVAYPGTGTLIENWNGSAWGIVAAPDLTPDDELSAVSATGPDDVWAVGTAFDLPTGLIQGVSVPLVEHWDGSQWSIVQFLGPGLNPFDSETIAALNAAENSGQPNSYESASLTGVDAISANDVWVSGYLSQVVDMNQTGVVTSFMAQWNGSGWTTIDVPGLHGTELGTTPNEMLNAVGGSAASGVWAVGSAAPEGTLVVRTFGAGLTVFSSPQTGSSGTFNAVAVVSSNDAWAVGDSISRWNGHVWTPTFTVGGKAVDPLTAIDAVSEKDVWMIGDNAFVHYNCERPG